MTARSVARGLVASLVLLVPTACPQDPTPKASEKQVEGAPGQAAAPAKAELPAKADPALPEPPAVDVELLRRHTRALSDDAMSGRRPGTEGGAKAVAYIVEQLQAMGLQPAGEDGTFTQRVPMRSVQLDPARTTVALRTAQAGAKPSKGGKPSESTPLRLGEDIVVGSMGPAGTTQIDAPLVFLGYGVTAPEHGWDDFDGVDLKGKIAVVFVGDPPVDDGRFGGAAMTYYGRWTYKYERALEAGALGCLIVHETAPASYGWNVVQSSWSAERFDLRTPDGKVPPHLAIQGWIHQDLAERLAGLGGRTLADLHALALRPDFAPLPLDVALVADVVTTEHAFADVNIVAKIPGRTRPDEHVLVSAHWDHLGVDAKAAAGQDAIFNGAVDNASGIAGMLAVAAGLQAKVRQGQGPGRSVLLLATTAEEQGLLGSRYYAEHPLVPLRSIVGVANIDSMNVHGRTTTISVTGKGQSTLEDVLDEVAAAQGRTLVGDARPEAGSYYRSDHFSFAKRGVPAIDFDGGPAMEEGGTAAGEALAKARAERYHTVEDEYDPAWPFTGALQDVEALLELVLRVAAAEEPPRWKPGSEMAGRQAGG